MANGTGGNQTGPLSGLKVIDLSHVMAGPTCAMLLADMGADVIKVEKIPGGDDAHRMVPPSIDGESAAFLVMNRNKRGIALDLKTEAGSRALSRLLEGADVLIENYRRGTMERMGFGYEALRALNPRLIYCSISGFGRTGPYADRGGFDLVAQGMSGLMSITGEGPGCPPMKSGAPVTDITAGILACVGILAALHSRASSGRGQMVDTSLFEAGIIQTYWQSAICFATGQAPGPMGTAHPLNAPYQAFAVADGWITVGAANQGNWLRLLEALEAPDLGDDSRFANNAERMRNLPALDRMKVDGPIYISFDMDALDPAFAPGISHREPGGMSVREAIAHLHAISGKIAGADIVEFNPAQDNTQITATVAAKLLKEILGKMILN